VGGGGEGKGINGTVEVRSGDVYPGHCTPRASPVAGHEFILTYYRRVRGTAVLRITGLDSLLTKLTYDAERFQILTAASMKVAAFWDVAPCSLVEADRHFRDSYFLYHRPVMETEHTSGTSVYFDTALSYPRRL
jgi:hypothetical protein